jgi:predicted DNA-binding antitoxin AbrB/MazE fold protein
MVTVTTTVVYEDGVLRPTEKLNLSEHHLYRAVILPVDDQDQQTLIDILGFDPENDQAMREVVEKQRQALNTFVGSATSDQLDDASVRHDEYLYGTDS